MPSSEWSNTTFGTNLDRANIDLMQFQAKLIDSTDNHLIDSYRVDGMRAPFKVFLINSAVKTYNNRTNAPDYHIPDMQDMIHSIVLYRTVEESRLRGADLKFLRRCLGLRAIEVSKKMSISREHFSRCENESVPLSSSLEILLRIFIFNIIANRLGSGLVHRGITLQSGLDLIFSIGSSNKNSDDSKEFVLNLRREPIDRDGQARARSAPNFAWIKADERSIF